MGPIRQVARRLKPTGDFSPPKKRPCTTPNVADFAAPVDWNEANARVVSREEYDQALRERDLALNELNNLRAEVQELQNHRSSALAEFELKKKELEAEKNAMNDRLDREFKNFASELTDVLKKLCKTEDELEKTSQERDRYRNSLELGKKEWEAEKKGLYDRLDKGMLQDVLKQLLEREDELEKTSQERDWYRNSLETGRKEWDAEKKALNEKLHKGFNNLGAQLKEVMKNLSNSEAELQKTSEERDSYRNSLELRKKEWEDEKIAMTQRLDPELKNFLSKCEAELGENFDSQELDTYRNSLELGNKVWEAAKIKMAMRIAMANKGMDTSLELRTKVAEAEKIETTESTAVVDEKQKKSNWPRWGAQEASYASNPLQDLQIGRRGY